MTPSLLRDGVLSCAIALTLGASASAQPRPLTLDTLYDPASRVNFSGVPLPAITWLTDGRYVVQRQEADGPAWVAVDAATGATQPLLSGGPLRQALVDAGASADAAKTRALSLDDRGTRVLAVAAGDLFVFDLARARATRLTKTDAEEEVASFSPDGRRVAYVRAGDLYVIDAAGGAESRLTTDGNDRVLNGRLDWVYEEEVFGRGQSRGYWWSPDSTRLAYLRLDDRALPVSTVVDHIPYEQSVERWVYPKVGDPNPLVTLGVVQATGGATRWLDLSSYPEADRLIAGVSWTPDSQQVVLQVQDRLQTRVDLMVGRADTGAVRRLLREASKAWVADHVNPTWLKDGSFLWLSEAGGFRHIERHAPDGARRDTLTQGAWEVRTLHGVDEAGGWVYFSGTERSPIGNDVYRVRLTGGPVQRLTRLAGTHTAEFSPTLTHFADTWSDVHTPPQLRIQRADGADAQVIEANPVKALGEYVLPKPEFLQVPTRDGFTMEAMMIKPPDFDPSRRYPVYMFVYGGPRSQTVRNAWRTENLFLQLLAQQGVLIWECDNRSASGKGVASAWPIYRNLGELELRDVEDGLAWLKRQPFVDGSRIGLHGWSYGGFLTTYALTHSQSFVMGIAGGTVSDWRDYDSIYTERHMGSLAENPEGYRKSSPRFAAASLSGALLLLHGLIDDNVHVDNTIQLAYELQRAHKPFEMMLYPRSRHGVTDPVLVRHMRTLMFDFVMRYLGPPSGSRPSRVTGPR